MSREYASPELGNLIAARLSPEEFDRRSRAPLTDAELSDIHELIAWFTRRYPTADARLAYARRKHRQYTAARGDRGAEAEAPSYRETATMLARAHHRADPETICVLLAPDPEEKEIRLVEVTSSAPTSSEPLPVEFAPRPDLGIPFSSAVLLLNPDDWKAVQAGQLELPPSWDLQRLMET